MTWKEIPAEDYHGSYRNYLSSSDIRRILRSPAHYRAPNPPPSAAQEIGTLVHECVLEPNMWKARCRPSPKIDRRTKEGKALADWQTTQELQHGIRYIDEDLFNKIEAIAHSVQSSLGTSGILTNGVAELSGLSEILETPVRIRPDYLRDDLIVDLKTCQDARDFPKSVFSWGYEIQAAFYLDVAKAIDGKERRFLWVAVEKDAPYGVIVYEPDQSVLERGRTLYRKAIETGVQCATFDFWPNYSTDVQTVTLPKYLMEY